MSSVRKSEETLNLKNIWFRYAQHWPKYALSIVGFLLIAVALLWYLPPKYKIKSRILIKDKNNTVTSTENFQENLDLFRTKRNLENEVGILKSYQFIHKVVSHLPFNVSYYESKFFKKTELYEKAPFELAIDTSHIQITGIPYKIVFTDPNTFHLSIKVGEAYPKKITEENGEELLEDYVFEGSYKIDEPIVTPYLSFKITKAGTEGLIPEIGRKYMAVVHTYYQLASHYQEHLSIEAENIESSIISVQTEGEVVRKERDFLNMLCETYVNAGLDEKNEIAKRTIDYINNQLAGIADSLSASNKRLLDFNSKNKVVDIDVQTKHNYEKLYQLEKERAGLLVKNKYYKYLYDYVNSNTDNGGMVAPSTIGIDDPLLSNLLSDLTRLNLEKASLSFSAHGDNPNLQMIELKIENTKRTLKENVKSIMEASQLALNENLASMMPINSTLSNLPWAERELINLKRVYDHYEQIYNYLMGKRAEAEIAKVSNTPHHTILDKAKPTSKTPFMPNKKLILLAALFLGFVFPTAVIAVMNAVKPTIEFKEDIIEITNTPIVETIFQQKKSSLGLEARGKSDESFKKIKAFLETKFWENKSGKIIGISSASKSEGKTFTAINLALSYAQSSYSTVLVDFNLRKPFLDALIDHRPSFYLHDCLQGTATIKEAANATRIPNLSIIAAAMTGFNVSELLSKGKVADFFDALKSNYDIIIVDSPPCILFSDYGNLAKHIHYHLFVVRKSVSSAEMVKHLDNFIETYGAQNSFLIFNGEKSNRIKKEMEKYEIYMA